MPEMIEIKNCIEISGQKAYLFRITNHSGAYMECTNIGASVVSLYIRDRNGALQNVVLGYNTLEEYITDPFYMGATVGRVANRISGASFILDGKVYNLDKNDGINSNHGGIKAFNTKLFSYKTANNGITFIYTSLADENGFPGRLRLEVTYFFTDDNELQIKYRAESDENTPIDITNHSYFNLDGDSVLNHLIQINADECLEMGNSFLPTGKKLKLDKNSAFDFRKLEAPFMRMCLKKELISGYNVYYIIRKEKGIKQMALLKSKKSGITMEAWATTPGFMLYTGDYLSKPFAPHGGICLECQYYPDAVNHKNFTGFISNPAKPYKETIIYKFGIDLSL